MNLSSSRDIEDKMVEYCRISKVNKGGKNMSIKKNVVMSIAAAVLGFMLIGGGTFAYFSDTAETDSTFAAGTLDINANPTVVIDVENIKPGDSFYRDFQLSNDGTLDIGKVMLETAYTVMDAEDDNGAADFGDFIEVEFLHNVNNNDEVIYRSTLAELAEMTPEAIDQHIMYPWYGEKGLPAGSIHDFIVKFNFVDNGEDQNVFQGDSLQLEWTFEAEQTGGDER